MMSEKRINKYYTPVKQRKKRIEKPDECKRHRLTVSLPLKDLEYIKEYTSKQQKAQEDSNYTYSRSVQDAIGVLKEKEEQEKQQA